MTGHPLALVLDPDDDDIDNPQRPETDVWTPGRVTYGADHTTCRGRSREAMDR